MDFLEALSSLCGWVYTIMWSLSFYPQWILNMRRRTTAGTTVDFPISNCLGFLSYVLSTVALRYSPTVRAEYAARHHGLTPTVAFNDVVFAVHSLVLCFVCVSQFILPQLWGWDKNDSRIESNSSGGAGGLLADEYSYDGRPQRQQQRQGGRPRPQKRVFHGNTRPSRFILGVMLGCVLGVGFLVLLVLRDDAAARGDAPYRGAQAMRAHMAAAAGAAAAGAVNVDASSSGGSGGSEQLSVTESAALLAAWMAGRWTWLDVVYALGYVKVVVTFVKYWPQVLTNYRNRSTEGWAILPMLLDFGGGVLSIAQLFIDSYRQRDWSGLTGNPVKLLLGNVSIGYDLIFFAQHYVLYPHGGEHGTKDDAEEGDEEEGDGESEYTNSRRIRGTEREALLSRE
ncbi:hypothetical protein SCUCBS95973_006114 [Sporothrix curviconia]|uniref:Cystinosin n=1 Tax=Sporothrix curviconia TaxID=1260050 RepID=A0ABP0C3K4_9PEZI